MLGAIEKSDLPKLRDCIARGANVNVKGRHGINPLVWAYWSLSESAFECLLNDGADVDERMNETFVMRTGGVIHKGDSILLYLSRDRSACKFLERAIAVTKDIDQRDAEGNSILHIGNRLPFPVCPSTYSQVAALPGIDINGKNISGLSRSARQKLFAEAAKRKDKCEFHA